MYERIHSLKTRAVDNRADMFARPSPFINNLAAHLQHLRKYRAQDVADRVAFGLKRTVADEFPQPAREMRLRHVRDRTSVRLQSGPR
jgi:hypothetical protein